MPGKPCMPRIMRCMPPLRLTFFIIFCICLCCLSSRLTSAICIPLPSAIRFFREPFIRSGKRRSFTVIESIRNTHALELAVIDLGFGSVGDLAHTWQLVEHAGDTTHIVHLLELVAKIFQIEFAPATAFFSQADSLYPYQPFAQLLR